MKEKQLEKESINTQRQHSSHRRRRHHRYKRRYSTERQSYNAQELRIMLMWSAFAVILMLVLIPLLTSLLD